MQKDMHEAKKSGYANDVNYSAYKRKRNLKSKKAKEAQEGFSLSFIYLFSLNLLVGVHDFLFYLSKSAFWEALFAFMLSSIIGTANFIMIRYYMRMRLRVEDQNRLLKLIEKEKRPYSITELAEDVFDTSEKRVITRLDRVLDYGEISEYYINYALRYLMFNHNLDWNNLEAQYLSGIHKQAYPCVKCGAVSFYQMNETKICNYCREPLVELTDDEILKNEEVVRNHSEKQYQKMKKWNLCSYIGMLLNLCLAVFFLIVFLNTPFSEEKRQIISSVLTVATIVIFVFLVISTYRRKVALKDYKVLKNILTREERPLPVKELATEFSLPENKMMKRIDHVLDHHLFPDMYLNESIGYFLFKDDVKNVRLQYQYLERYEIKACVCENCGATTKIRKHQNAICSFCGHPMPVWWEEQE